MIQGSCLCGGVRFEVERLEGPFELCHCSRCRKASGSSHVAGVRVRTADYRLLAGADLIAHFELPVRDTPPAYGSVFCKRCGSPVPPAEPAGESFEIAAGLLEGPLNLRPDRHIYVEYRADWDDRLDELPGFTAEQIRDLRAGQG
ncbi:MAG: GFA family protein [Myxococcales bacterium]|nr:GFA family protein [Myxococcales bacterium]